MRKTAACQAADTGHACSAVPDDRESIMPGLEYADQIVQSSMASMLL